MRKSERGAELDKLSLRYEDSVLMSAIFLFKNKNSFNFWLHLVFVALHGLSVVVVSGAYSSLPCTAFSLQ